MVLPSRNEKRGKLNIFPPTDVVETVGIEPTSESIILKTPTCVVCLFISPQVSDRQESYRLSLKMSSSVSLRHEDRLTRLYRRPSKVSAGKDLRERAAHF